MKSRGNKTVHVVAAIVGIFIFILSFTLYIIMFCQRQVMQHPFTFTAVPEAGDVIEGPKNPICRDPETPVKDNLIPTPQAPSIAFPLANPPVAPEPKEKVRQMKDHLWGIVFWEMM